MEKYYAIILLILIIGCGGPKEEDYPITDKDFKKGTAGLEFEFYESGPPSNVFEEEEFEIVADIWNKGAYTTNMVYLTTIVENDYMELTGEPKTQVVPTDVEKLQGRSVSFPEGTSTHFSVKAKAKKLDLLSVQHTSPVILTACYNYMTEVAEDVCIDPDPNSKANKVCEIQDITMADQGAPIAITKIETKVLPDGDQVSLQFVLHIENKGDGEVVEFNRLKEACSSSSMGLKDWNHVYLKNFKFSNTQYEYDFTKDSNKIECAPNPLRLITNKDYIRCTIKNSNLPDTMKLSKNSPSYISQAYINLAYGYTHSISKNVVIESKN